MSSAGDQGRGERAQPTRGVAADAGAATVQAVRWASRRVRGHMVDAVGGPARARVITLLACVLALNSADTSTIGAVAPQLKRALHINNAQIGLLSSVTLLVGAVVRDPLRAAGGSGEAGPDARRERRALERRVDAQRDRRQLLDAAADAPVDGGRHRDGRARDRVAHRRLLPLARARAHLRLHPRRRDRRNGDRLHDQRLRREPALLAGRVHPDRDPRLLPRALAVPDPARAPARRPEPPCPGRRRPPRRGRRHGRPTGRGRRRQPRAQEEIAHQAIRDRGVQADPKLVLREGSGADGRDRAAAATCSRSPPTGC